MLIRDERFSYAYKTLRDTTLLTGETVDTKSGDEGARTPDPDTASVVLSQLSYIPMFTVRNLSASFGCNGRTRHWLTLRLTGATSRRVQPCIATFPPPAALYGWRVYYSCS
jgi:hypothetical protein